MQLHTAIAARKKKEKDTNRYEIKISRAVTRDYDPMVRVSPTYRRRWSQCRREEEKGKAAARLARPLKHRANLRIEKQNARKGGRRRKEPREERDAEWSAYKVDTK